MELVADVVGDLVDDIINEDMPFRDISNVDFTDRNLVNVFLDSANAQGSNFTGANLGGSFLMDADFTNANLSGANLSGSSLRNAILVNANLTGADLQGTTLTGANLHGANLTGANLNRADLTDADLSWSYLAGARLDNAIINNANFIGTIYDPQQQNIVMDRPLVGADLRSDYPASNQVVNQQQLENVTVVEDIDYCPICQLEGGEGIRTSCGHEFHAPCLLQWKRMDRRDCPICRQVGMFFGR